MASLDFFFPLPSNEPGRLVALDRLRIVGTAPAPEFDAMLALMLQITGCDVGFIGLMEAERLWLKAEAGVGSNVVPRQVALCNYTLLQNDPFIVEDLARDRRFKNNPFVTERGARFYAGIALVAAGGFNVGTLCVMDRGPRVATPEVVDALRHLGRVVQGLLAAHQVAVESVLLASTAEAREREGWKKTRLIAQCERMAKVGAWEYDLERGTFFASDESYRILELEIGSVIEIEVVGRRQSPAFRQRAAACFDLCRETGQGYDITGELVNVGGPPRWVQIVAEAEKQDDKVVRVFGSIRDVTAERLAERTLWRAAHYDALTDVPNRHYWTMRLDEAFAAEGALTIVLLDLNEFKEINDTRGHATGDMVLRAIARRLVETLPQGSFHARLGGDEFAIMLLGMLSTACVEEVVREILAAIRRPINVDGARIQLSGTIGLARYPADASTASDLMQKADIALYQAKRSHRNSFVAFQPSINGIFDAKRHAIELVAAAIEQNRLVPFYQRKIDLETGRVIGFEALCRIEATDGTILGPSQFHQVFQDPASAARIGATMLALVTADIASWLASGLSPGRVALNVTSADFAEGDLAERVIERLAALRLPPSAIEIEVTENTILGKEAVAVNASLQAMSDHGISIALDDFGTGFASLTHLRDAPIKCIKLDRSFIAGLGTHADSAIIVKSIADLGHCLGMRIVAEGIETRGQAEFLRAIGCDEAQGFLFGHPASRASTWALLARQDPVARPALAG